MFDLKPYLDSKRKMINNSLNEILKDTQRSRRLITAMEYSIMAGGKRLRPVFCIAAAGAVGGKGEDVLKTACALEMIHTYSLIHDDLPAMDNDDLRRGKPSCHVAFDEATAILAGDALLTLAFQILSEPPGSKENHSLKSLYVVNIIAKAAGFEGMIEGQMRDILLEGKQVKIEELEKMHYLKTGALIEASVCSGAILGGGKPEDVERLAIYAKNIGIAFQITDDILDVEGDPAVMGKAAGTDKICNKTTYPSLLGVEKSKALAKITVKKALQSLELFDNVADPLRAIAKYILERKK